jgi:4-hydroxybenzoate polyprenyltransferase
MIILAYMLLMVGYTFGLKEIVILDAFVIALGFVLRGLAGGEVLQVEISPWFMVCAFLLALFIVFCKRKHELLVLTSQAISHRRVLADYNQPLLDTLVSVVTAAVAVTYSLYTLVPETIAKFQTSNLVYTIPFVLFGLFRYLFLVYKKEEGGSAEKLMLTDPFLIINMLVWVVLVVIIIYGGKFLS